MEKQINASKKELFYDEFSSKWEKNINNLETQKRLKVVYEILLSDVDLRNKNFLEIGCGMGYFCKEAVKKGAKVTGVDVGKSLLNISKKKIKKARFLQANASKLPFKNSTYDIVLCTEVIEHVDDQTNALKEMLRVVKKDGLIVITTPNKIYKPLFASLNKVGLRPYDGNEKWFFTWSLKKFINKNGGKIIKTWYFNIPYPSKPFEYLENFQFLKDLMVNQSYLIERK